MGGSSRFLRLSTLPANCADYRTPGRNVNTDFKENPRQSMKPPSRTHRFLLVALQAIAGTKMEGLPAFIQFVREFSRYKHAAHRVPRRLALGHGFTTPASRAPGIARPVLRSSKSSSEDPVQQSPDNYDDDKIEQIGEQSQHDLSDSTEHTEGAFLANPRKEPRKWPRFPGLIYPSSRQAPDNWDFVCANGPTRPARRRGRESLPG